MPNSFEFLRTVDVTPFLGKKGRLDYLAWPHAWNLLLKFYPKSKNTQRNWPLVVFTEQNGPIWMENMSVPYAVTPEGYMCEVTVDLGDDETPPKHANLFVMDHKNNAIQPQPYGNGANLFDINATIQRCLVKAIAMHGLGLDVYSKADNKLDPMDAEGQEMDGPGKASETTETEGKSKPGWKNRQEALNEVKALTGSEDVNKWLSNRWIEAINTFNKRDLTILENEIKSHRDGLRATEELQDDSR